MEEFLAEGKGVFWIMVEKEKTRSEQSQGPDPESALGEKEGSTSGGPEGTSPAPRKPGTNQVPVEAEEGATEAVPSSAPSPSPRSGSRAGLGRPPTEKGVELTEKEFMELKKMPNYLLSFVSRTALMQLSCPRFKKAFLSFYFYGT